MPPQRRPEVAALASGIIYPGDHQPAHEVSDLLMPQFEMITDLSVIDEITNGHPNNKHHLFWPRTSYATQTEKLFRRYFVLPLNMGVHRELHARVEPPPKPSRDIMLGYLMLKGYKNGQQAAA